MYELHSFVYLFRCLPVAVSQSQGPGLLATESKKEDALPALC